MSGHRRTISADRDDSIQPPSRFGKDARTAQTGPVAQTARGSFVPTVGTSLSNYNSDGRPSTSNRADASKPDYFGAYATHRTAQLENVDKIASDVRQAEYRGQIQREEKIKLGSENLLEALNFKSAKQTKDQRMRVEDELKISNRKIAQLKNDLEKEIQKAQEPTSPPAGRLSQLFLRGTQVASPTEGDFGEETELGEEIGSPTFTLAEILRSLEADGLPPDYYVDHSNNLIELFKRNQTLKYDLVWSIFGLRVQSMLLSDSREMAAAGYRMLRYAITDKRSLSIMRSFSTDYLVILSLIKDNKASIEREQALKFVRAFLDVKGGVHEISKAVVRVIVAVAEHGDDKMKNISILTLSEIMVKSPELLVASGGMGLLTDTLAEGHYHPASSLSSAFLYLLEAPSRRPFLASGHEIQGPLAVFSEDGEHVHESRLKANAAVVSSLLKSWQGLLALSKDAFIAIKSLMTSLRLAKSVIKDIILEIILDVLQIKPPSWSSSFYAGRRLTTYNAVISLRDGAPKKQDESQSDERRDLVDHFRAIVLATFLESGLLQSLQFTVYHETEPSVRRKATLLLGEALHLANRILPKAWTAQIQILPRIFADAAHLESDERHTATGTIYQIDSVNRTLYRSNAQARLQAYEIDARKEFNRSELTGEDVFVPSMDENLFRQYCLDSQVLGHSNYIKWKWDLVQKLVEGPLLNPKRLHESIQTSKFMKRLIGFYRPFKYRFSEVRNTRPNQRYVRVGCALFKTLLQTPEGTRYLADNKLIGQIAECLAQIDRLSGITSASPLFSSDRLSDTLSGGYFALIGVLSAHSSGLMIMDRWKIANMFYHIVDLTDSETLVRTLLSSMDYTLDSHLRIVLSKALTSSSQSIRTYSTQLLRKYATQKIRDEEAEPTVASGCAQWAIDLLVMQLYDPQVEVCEVAIRILEEACDDRESLEYVVQCRPALDHLGEIGAPLLLRFLSTSIGYQYLDGLDYISQEMDDWFLGRNDSYVSVLEAAMTHALSESPSGRNTSLDQVDYERPATVAPPHFYRELTRTREGCRLLEEKGHFQDFVSILRQSGLEDSDPETLIKVKGSLWALANIGCMELGSPFLEESDAVELIINIAEHSDVLSVRGTAIFALGLISKSIYGQEIIAEHGWDVCIDELGTSMGICLPRDLRKLHELKLWRPSARVQSMSKKLPPQVPTATDDDAAAARVLGLVSDLGNTVLSKPRASELHGIKTKNPAVFSPQLLPKVMDVFSQHHFRLPALRFVLDLFDKSVFRKVVLEGGEESEESEDDIDESLVTTKATRSPLRSP